jgi:hypothetical protein
MTSGGGKKSARTGAGVDDAVTPPPVLPALPKIDLRNLEAIKREIGTVYREARGGGISPTDATKLVFILNVLVQVARTVELEDRLQQIERLLESRTVSHDE